MKKDTILKLVEKHYKPIVDEYVLVDLGASIDNHIMSIDTIGTVKVVEQLYDELYYDWIVNYKDEWDCKDDVTLIIRYVNKL